MVESDDEARRLSDIELEEKAVKTLETAREVSRDILESLTERDKRFSQILTFIIFGTFFAA